MAYKCVSALKFVGTVSLGLLTGVSYSMSTLALPTIVQLPSAPSASHALTTLTAALRRPVLALTTLSHAALLAAFALSPRSARHPYLLYTSLLAALSSVAPGFVLPPLATPPGAARPARRRQQTPPARRLDASYEVLGDPVPASGDDDQEDLNGEEVRLEIDGLSRAFLVRAGVSAVGFAMALVGLWGDGTPPAVVVVS